MSDLNRVQLLGTIDGAPTLKMVNEKELVTFRLAIATGRGQAVHTSWFTVTAWGGLAREHRVRLVAGARVFVDGALRVRSYEHQGQKRTSTEVEARALLVSATAPAAAPQPQQEDFPPPDFGGETDIPF